MKSINLESNKEIVKDWVEIFFECQDCMAFELRKNSRSWFYCPICLQERDENGEIDHKDPEMLYN